MPAWTSVQGSEIENQGVKLCKKLLKKFINYGCLDFFFLLNFLPLTLFVRRGITANILVFSIL